MGLVGISVDWYKIRVYIFQGACVGVAVTVLIGPLNGASPGQELHIIAGVVLGGTALYGGVGTLKM